MSATNLAVERLWGGYSSYASERLARIITTQSSSRHERRTAAWQLARWHASFGEAAASLLALRLMPPQDSSARLAKSRLLLEIRTLVTLGRTQEAQSLASLALTRYEYGPDWCMTAANALIERAASAEAQCANDERRLELVNRMYTARGLLTVRKIEPSVPLGLDNITAALPGETMEQQGPTVSVILPAYNAASTVGYALRSLREQTWRKLQIIVVDDASSDATCAVVEEAARLDDRISLVRLDQNRGTYVARNTGLERATGEYVTVHDADDWSHPQKIEAQVNGLQDGDHAASLTHWVRTSPELEFNGEWQPSETLIQWNYSSFMLRTALLRDFGGWDPVRLSADSELIGRVEAKFGPSSVLFPYEDTPLSFALDTETSLTRSPDTHLRSLYFGMLNAYLSAYERWHVAAQQSRDFYTNPDPYAPRKFPAPGRMLSSPIQHASYDVVVVADFAKGRMFLPAYQEVLAALRSSLRVGILHWPSYRRSPNLPLESRICELLDGFKVELVDPEQTLETKHLIFHNPAVLQYRLDRVPRISFETMQVVTGSFSETDGGDPSAQYDAAIIRENLESLFGSAGEWRSTSTLAGESVEV